MQPNDVDQQRSAEHAVVHHGPQPFQDKLRFLQWEEWDKHNTYNEFPPICVRYSIECSVAVKKKRNKSIILRDTEPNVVLAPSLFWTRVLFPRLTKVLKRKFATGTEPKPDDCLITVSVTDRSERDFVKQFDKLKITWSTMEDQLASWGHYLLKGRKLRIAVVINMTNPGGPSDATPRSGKVGRRSASTRMLSQLDEYLQRSGPNDEPPAWQKIKKVLRCDNEHCDLGPHCWYDAHEKRHIKVMTGSLNRIVDHVEKGNQFQSREDVPVDIRRELYAVAQQKFDRHHKSSNVSSAQALPIHITNVIPAHASASCDVSTMDTAASGQATGNALAGRLIVPGPRDVALKDYIVWQQNKVEDEEWKLQFAKIGEALLKARWDLEQVHLYRKVNLQAQTDIQEGVIRSVIDDVIAWAKTYVYEGLRVEFV